ncbi:MAG: hypothetical protein PHW08_00495 [Kiritimatiellae bacterium]|nr:hypothetical protein [Kiritimatiellia bacterium]
MKTENTKEHAELEVEPIETKWIPIDEIEPHPDALAFWGGDDSEEPKREGTAADQDAGALKNSVAMHGNFEAALVTRKEDDRGWWLLDGCSRLAGAVQGGRDSLYCTVVAISPENYGKLMMEVNMNRRRVSTPARVLRYLELYRNEVLAAAEKNADPSATGAKGGRGKKALPMGRAFSTEAIRERLHCRFQEVTGGILALKCQREGAVPYMDAKRKWQLRPATDDELKKRDALLDGIRKGASNMNLSRWAQGLDGKLKTEGVTRAPTDYANVLDCATTKLNTAFTNWHEVETAARPGLINEFCKVMEKMPKDFLFKFGAVVAELYPGIFESGKVTRK